MRIEIYRHANAQSSVGTHSTHTHYQNRQITEGFLWYSPEETGLDSPSSRSAGLRALRLFLGPLVGLNISFRGPSWQHLSEPRFLSLTPPDAPMSTKTQRKRSRFWPAAIPTRFSFCCLLAFLISPCGLELKRLICLPCVLTKLLFFFLTGGQWLPGSCRGSSLSFPSAVPAGEDRSMTLLVTSDTAQLLPVDQMERKRK